jgi:8-amino-7-oxononanoate synthase
MRLEKAPNRTLSVNGITDLHFSGTSYLGMAALPEFHEIIFENIKNGAVVMAVLEMQI